MLEKNQEQQHDLETMVKICERAEAMGIEDNDRITLMLDIEHANEQFGLRLRELLDADDFNFAHDIIGIQRHIDRRTGFIGDLFVPRFAGKPTKTA